MRAGRGLSAFLNGFDEGIHETAMQVNGIKPSFRYWFIQEMSDQELAGPVAL